MGASRFSGHRSIIADPANEEMRRKLNLKIKYSRELPDPFAPMVLEEDMAQYFELDITFLPTC
jgi:carbamoyltransferase